MTLALHLDRDKLAKVLGMLGSHHDGEALSAARMASTLVRSAGVTWHDVLALSPDLAGQNYDVAAACNFCLKWPKAITDWERQFLSSLLVRQSPLSEKQSKVLVRIVERVETFATASYSS